MKTVYPPTNIVFVKNNKKNLGGGGVGLGGQGGCERIIEVFVKIQKKKIFLGGGGGGGGLGDGGAVGGSVGGVGGQGGCERN